jgi:uncharacterized protein
VTKPRDARTDPGEVYFQTELVASFRNDSLHLILLPTEQCNFRCTYCYEDFSIGRMNSDTLIGIKRLVDRRVDDLSWLSVSWFGGEPMLAFRVVEDISEHIVRAVSERGKQISYTADMTTNGYLLDSAKLLRLANLGIRHFQISLDGPDSFHDRTRVRANGKGSFDHIWQNLLAVRVGKAPVDILLRIHLTPDNLPTMPDFLVRVKETFLDDQRFKVLLKPVEHLGGPNDETTTTIPVNAQAEIIRQLEELISDGTNTRSVFSAPEICYAARPNSLVIRADGRVGKCTVALSDKRNTIGQLLPNGSLEIDTARLNPWINGWSSGNLATLACPYSNFMG